MAHIGFKKLQGQLEAKGYSPDSAARITASIGRKKYGKKGMKHLAAEARRRVHQHAKSKRSPRDTRQVDGEYKNA